MARLKHRNTRPPGNFRYVEPSTRAFIEADNHGELMKLVLAHRRYKNLPRATLAEVTQDVERQICASLSNNECTSEGPLDELRPVTETRTLTLVDVMKFSKAAIGWLASGAKVVPMEQLKKRQNSCLGCQLNSKLKACSCSAFYKTIDALVPADRRDPGLKICQACLCSTVAKTQMPLEMVDKADEGRNITYPALCWVSLERGEKSRLESPPPVA